jgi:hypothetical protein
MARPDVRIVSICLASVSFETRMAAGRGGAQCDRPPQADVGRSYRLQMKRGSNDVKRVGKESSPSWAEHPTTVRVRHESRSDDTVSHHHCSGLGRDGPCRLRFRQACDHVAASGSLRRDRASGQRADHDRPSWTDFRISRGPGPRSRRRHRAEARIQGRQRGQGGAAPLPDRPRALYRRAEQRAGLTAEGGSQSCIDHSASRALQDTGRRQRGQQAGLRQRRGHARASCRRRCDG